MPPVRVLHLITRLIVGGAQENTLYTAAGLDPRRYQVTVLSGPQTGSEGSLIEEARQQGIALELLPTLVRQISPLQDLRTLQVLVQHLRQERYTIIHTHSSKAGILGRIAAHVAGVPVILHTVHGWSFHDYMPLITRWLYILLERLCARYSDVLIVVTRRDEEKGLRAGIGRPDQYRLIRSAIPLQQFDPSRGQRQQVRLALNIPQQALVLGNIGRFSPQKNPLDWVRIAGSLAERYPDLYFLMVGDGPLRPAVEAELQRQGIASRTRLTGLRRDIPQMLSAMDIFLLTSLWEGLPRVLPQAMSMGLPVVANQADGTQEAIQHGVTGFLVQPGHLEKAVNYCAQLIEDPALRRSLGEAGQEFARREFDLARMLEQIDQTYQELLERSLSLSRS